MQKVDIVIPVYGALEDLERCIRNLTSATDQPYKLHIVDDGNRDRVACDVLEMLRQAYKFDLLHHKAQRGFPASCNTGWRSRKAANPYVCFLNSDTVPAPGWLGLLVHHMDKHPKCGAVGPSTSFSGTDQCMRSLRNSRLNVTDDDIRDIGSKVLNKYGKGSRSCELSGFCFMTRRSLLVKTGGFPEDYGLGYGEENHYQIVIRSFGFCTTWVRAAYVHHLGRRSFRAIPPEQLRVLHATNRQRLARFKRIFQSNRMRLQPRS